MNDKEKIRAEVERLKDELIKWPDKSEIDLGRISAFEDVLLFIDSLPEEPASEFLNTESMIESYKQRLISQANGVKNSPLISMCLASYKHGINETLDTLNLSNVQRTIKKWKEEPVSEDLEEAAKNHAAERYRTTRDEFLAEKCKWSFIAGAKWNKEKMMKDAVDAHILDSANPVTEDIVSRYISCYYENKDNTPFIQAGDKIKLIIIKEE